jgi:hypothetical protein
VCLKWCSSIHHFHECVKWVYYSNLSPIRSFSSSSNKNSFIVAFTSLMMCLFLIVDDYWRMNSHHLFSDHIPRFLYSLIRSYLNPDLWLGIKCLAASSSSYFAIEPSIAAKLSSMAFWLSYFFRPQLSTSDLTSIEWSSHCESLGMFSFSSCIQSP